MIKIKLEVGNYVFILNRKKKELYEITKEKELLE